MRLIDADALIPSEVHTVVVLKEGGTEVLESVLYAEQIDYAPTVDAEPVRYGRWVFSSSAPDGSDRYVCSECNCGYVREAYRYCPACGAKMR